MVPTATQKRTAGQDTDLSVVATAPAGTAVACGDQVAAEAGAVPATVAITAHASTRVRTGTPLLGGDATPRPRRSQPPPRQLAITPPSAGAAPRVVPGVGEEEGPEGVPVLRAGRAALEVRAQPGHGGVRVAAGELELDVAVELVEALLAADLGPGRAEQARASRRSGVVRWRRVMAPSSRRGRRGSRPRAASELPRSLRRASCSVL